MAWIKAIPPKLMNQMTGIYKGNGIPEMDRCWMDYDRNYQVLSRLVRTNIGYVEHVTMMRINHTDPLHAGKIGWAEKQMIKNELFGEDRVAIEVYPKQDMLVDVCDVYHLWVFEKDFDLPYGIGIHPYEFKKAEQRDIDFNEIDLANFVKEHELKCGGDYCGKV